MLIVCLVPDLIYLIFSVKESRDCPRKLTEYVGLNYSMRLIPTYPSLTIDKYQ